jgi:hypothetical protein
MRVKFCRKTAAEPNPLSKATASVQVRHGQQALRVDDPLPGEPRGGRRTVVGLEAAGERARRHVRASGELVDGEVEAEVLEHQSVIGESESDVDAGSGVAMNCACPPSRCGARPCAARSCWSSPRRARCAAGAGRHPVPPPFRRS